MLIDDTGAVENYYTYDPFGTLFDNESSTTAVENPYRFAGYWLDDEIAQYYCRVHGHLYTFSQKNHDDNIWMVTPNTTTLDKPGLYDITNFDIEVKH